MPNGTEYRIGQLYLTLGSMEFYNAGTGRLSPTYANNGKLVCIESGQG